jgi:exodeoxyribonuclease VII large subunit
VGRPRRQPLAETEGGLLDLLPPAEEDGPGEVAREALSVGEVLSRAKEAVARAFPAGARVWVRGELQKATEAQSGHCYLDLVDPEAEGSHPPVLKASCWRSTWQPLKRLLAEEGVTLAEGMVVLVLGRVELYEGRGQLQLIVDELDVDALLGRLAAARRALIRQLAKEGLLEANKRRPLVPVPLRVGLVASPGSEGCRDFLGQLAESGFGFSVRLWPVTVQGATAAGEVAAAVTALGQAGCDLVCVVRGGGARGDLVAFDTEVVARAVARCPVPVWTGIGHSGDESVADLVAHEAWRTPTACGRALVDRVGVFWASVVERAERVARGAERALAGTSGAQELRRRRLAGSVRGQVARQRDLLAVRAERVGRAAPRQVTEAQVRLGSQTGRLAPGARMAVARQADRVAAWQRLLAAYDVQRQLERGYSLTYGPDGRLVRQVADVMAGERLQTRLADGLVHSRVEEQASVPGSGRARGPGGVGG